MKVMWDQRYSEKGYVYGRMPNNFLKNFIDNEPPARILLPGEGEGRNAVYAARKGWQVFAVDLSEEGKKKALTWAHQNNVEIDYQVADLNTWNAPLMVECVALVYTHFSSAFRLQIHQKLIDKLIPGGFFILEAFSKKQINYDSGGPKNIDMLYDEKLLKEDFKSLKIDFLQERVIDLDEGRFHRGEASIIRMIAKKK